MGGQVSKAQHPTQGSKALPNGLVFFFIGMLLYSALTPLNLTTKKVITVVPLVHIAIHVQLTL